MSIPKTNWQERTQQNHGLIGDFASHPSQYLGNQQGWNMGIRVQAPIMDAVPLQQNFRPDKSCSSIMKSFESPASAFYATERFMGLQQYDCQGGSSPSLSSQYTKSYDSQAHAHHPAAESYSIDSAEQADHSFEPESNLRSGPKSHFSSDHYYKSLDKSYKGQCISVLGSRYHPYERNKLPGTDAAGYLQSPLAVPFQASQDHRDGRNPYGSSFAQLGFSCQQDKLSPRFSSVGVSSGNSVPNGAVLASKTRIRWTQDLHEKFVECVNRLGGAEKATPKAILKLMDSDGLTIFHVKSHLQKYRIAKYMPDPSEGKAEKRTSMNDISPLDVKTSLQLREALQLQWDVQRRLHEQLEIQRNLQLRIEEQGRKLKMMFDQHQKSSLFKNQNSDVTSLDETAFGLEDFEVSNAGGSNNTLFPSKIS